MYDAPEVASDACNIITFVLLMITYFYYDNDLLLMTLIFVANSFVSTAVFLLSDDMWELIFFFFPPCMALLAIALVFVLLKGGVKKLFAFCAVAIVFNLLLTFSLLEEEVWSKNDVLMSYA